MAQPSTPLPAATVVLIRPDQKGRFETYLNRRPERMETYAGVYVFPGGRVEKSDLSPALMALTGGVSAVQAQQKLGVSWPPEVCLAYWIAAARELFEEAGIHFFHFACAAPTVPLPEEISGRLAERRAQLQRGEIDLAELLGSENLCCDLSGLSYFFHRVTPEHYPVRFDTRFFLAILPKGQTPLHSSEEVTESFWIAPDAALERAASGEIRMMPPTIAVLRALDAHATWTDVCKWYTLG
jgi:8-oxo-dGTP pyrophosphatase MutT (NUDIX family)